MKYKLLLGSCSGLVGIVALGVVAARAAQDPKVFPKDAGPFHMDVVKGPSAVPQGDWNHDYPLADQSNSGHWKPNPDFTDEFNSTALDASKWWPKNPNTGGGADPKNVVLTGSGLNLLLTKRSTPIGGYNYAGGVIFSKKLASYGYYEAEVQVASDFANDNFFLYKIDPDQHTELDVFEIYGRPAGSQGIDSMNAIVFNSPTVTQTLAYQQRFLLDNAFRDNYHVFGIRWTPDEIEWDLDGHTIRKGKNTSWHQPLNETLGCWDKTANDQMDASQFPGVMKVRYVRAWTQ